MGDPSKDILQELEQLVPALTPFRSLIIVVFACLGAGFWYGHTIVGDGERAALKEQVELYKAKLQVGSPDEALKKMQALEAKIDALEPKEQRRLTAE